MVPELEWQPVKDIGPSSLRCKDTKKNVFFYTPIPPPMSLSTKKKKKKKKFNWQRQGPQKASPI